ncbi:MAG: 3-deoxy-7-phosphoheptulonate synthase [Polyangiaceae bacterium]
MIVNLSHGADLDAARRALTGLGLWIERVERSSRGDVSLLVANSSLPVPAAEVERIPGVSTVTVPTSAHPKIDAMGSSVELALGLSISNARPLVIAGPCAVESEAQIDRLAASLARAGVRVLRGGAFKPRTSPYSFQGHGRDALGWMRRAARAHDMAVVTEVLSEGDVELVASHADLLQVGSRNMQNYALLRAVGRAGRPVLLKRSMAATLEEWLLAGEHLLANGARGVVFCERGIRTFDDQTRNLLDLGAVALLAHVHGLPVVVDPSHATGRRDLIGPLARASLAAGAAGVMIEVHDDPASAASDGAQALSPERVAPIVDLASSLSVELQLGGPPETAALPPSRRSSLARGSL